MNILSFGIIFWTIDLISIVRNFNVELVLSIQRIYFDPRSFFITSKILAKLPPLEKNNKKDKSIITTEIKMNDQDLFIGLPKHKYTTLHSKLRIAKPTLLGWKILGQEAWIIFD